MGWCHEGCLTCVLRGCGAQPKEEDKLAAVDRLFENVGGFLLPSTCCMRHTKSFCADGSAHGVETGCWKASRAMSLGCTGGSRNPAENWLGSSGFSQ